MYDAYERARPGARPVDVLMDLITDELFRAPGVQLAESRAELGHPVWAYEFDFPAPAQDGVFAAAHCLELPFVFDNLADWAHAPLAEGIDPAAERGLADAMHRAWISFIRTGDPNHAAMPEWKRYGADTRTTMRFGSATAPVDDLAEQVRRLYGRVSARE